MLSFHGKQEVKDFYLNRVIAHQLADEIEKGYYWENGKGCAVGCTIHGNDHSKYEKELGIPRILARLEDGIFEGLPNDRAKLWPKEFLDAIPIGKDLSRIWPEFAIWLLIDEENGVIKYAKTEEQRSIIQKVANIYKEDSNLTYQEIRIIRNAAAAYAAAVADAAVTDAAAAYAAVAAAYAAVAAADAAAAYAAVARQNMRVIQANKLLELLMNCK